jgi:cobalt-zinc-cadmium efflux system protein
MSHAHHDHHDHDHRDEEHGHHDGGHGHGHHHAVTADGERRILWVLLLTGGFMVVEVVGGLLSGSLALLADAAHMLTDTAALALAWAAFRFGRRPADSDHSYGWRRTEVLAAYTNGIALFAIAGWIVVEAIQRLVNPAPVLAGEMMVVAVAGLVVNVAGFLILRGGDHGNLNLRGAVIHVLGDLLGSVAAIAAAGIILATNWTPADPLLSVVVALLVLKTGWDITRESGHILLEGVPRDFDPDGLGAAVREIADVIDVHHLHAWSLTSDRRLATLHAVVADAADDASTVAAINRLLRERFGIDHATVQIERGACCADREHVSHG